MYLHRLALCHFRNVRHAQIVPDPGLNVLWGDNAQGKTNVLEGIYLLGNLKSFRGARNEQLIRNNAEQCSLAGDVVYKEVRRKIELTIGPKGKTIRVNDKEVRTAGNFLGYLRPVLFSPEEVNLVKGYPAGRRALLDRTVFQADPTYLKRAQEYERFLKQRNRLLREGRSTDEIIPWTEGLIKAGARLRLDRFRYLNHLVPLLRETYRHLTGGKEQADLQYPVAGDTEETLQDSIRRELERERERERRLGQTMAGPHRDDPLFLVNGRVLRLYGSQGQQRSFMLAFKTAQIMDLENRIGEPPVLLLDDMTSELDKQRQAFFFRFLLANRRQVFITTTDIQPMINEGFRYARFFRVENGEFQEDCRQ
jgi:DNA replication and repair protein RecF